MNSFSSPAVVGALIVNLAVLVIMASGFCVMCGYRQFGMRFLLVGVTLAAAAGMVPTYPGFSADTWLTVLGVCAFILGARRLAFLLFIPAIVRWALLPLWPGHSPTLLFTFALPAFGIACLFVSLLLLQGFVRRIYGPHAAGQVSGVYLVRIFDSTGRAVGKLLSFPLRLAWLALTHRSSNRNGNRLR
jgi:hypothetical protein